MKKFKNILYVVILIITISSCTKTLELAPEDYYGDGNFWQNEAQVTNYMVGLHNQFRNNQFMFVRLGEMRGGGYSNIDRQNTSLNELTIINQAILETSAGVGNWAGFYAPILQLNLFISKVEPMTFLPADKKSYLLAQAYAMRGFYYFHLLRTYGGVPIVLEPEVLRGNIDAVTLRKARSTEAEVLAVVKAEVLAVVKANADKAVELFGTAATPADKSAWNPMAAQMLKGEVYLWSAKVYGTTADLAVAKTALNAATGATLRPNFADAFSYGNKNNSEIIMAIRYRVGEAEMSNYATYLYSTFNFDNLHVKDSTTVAPTLVDPLVIANTNSMQIIQRYGYTFELFQSYQLADRRRNATFYDYYKTTGTPPNVTVTIRNTALVKFPGTIDAGKRYFSDDWDIFPTTGHYIVKQTGN